MKKDLIGYPNYCADDQGFVYNKRTGKRLKGVPVARDGHLRVCLPIGDGKHRYKSVHREVYKAFNPDVDITGKVIHHIDGCPTNNGINNLTLLDTGNHISEHLNDKLARGFRVNRKLSDESVHGICRDLRDGVPYSCILSKYGCSRATLYQIKRKKQWVHISKHYL